MLRERARSLKGRVVFAGELDDPEGVLAATSVFVAPSYREAFGLAALEAQMAGVPVIASDTGGLSELVSDIDSERKHGNLSSALRLFVLSCFRTASPVAAQVPAAAQVVTTGQVRLAEATPVIIRGREKAGSPKDAE